jgi:hypothetical protein
MEANPAEKLRSVDYQFTGRVFVGATGESRFRHGIRFTVSGQSRLNNATAATTIEYALVQLGVTGCLQSGISSGLPNAIAPSDDANALAGGLSSVRNGGKAESSHQQTGHHDQTMLHSGFSLSSENRSPVSCS